MKIFKMTVDELVEKITEIKVGDRVLLSGTVYTARDAAHKKLCEMIKSGRELPFVLKNSAVYYAGPTPTPEHLSIGSCGPTTSIRMDAYAPLLLDHGLKIMIGKGQRTKPVIDSMIKNSAVYLCAIGGAGALAAKCITECEVIAFDELGCESVKKLRFADFPLIVGIDAFGNSLFK